MKEKFNNWNELKQLINKTEKDSFYVKQREIWYVNLGINIGHESNGKGNDYRRPVLIIKKVGNMYLTLPMTSKGIENNYKCKLPSGYFKNNSFLVISQAKFIDHKRFIRKINVLNKVDFEIIKKRLITDWF